MSNKQKKIEICQECNIEINYNSHKVNLRIKLIDFFYIFIDSIFFRHFTMSSPILRSASCESVYSDVSVSSTDTSASPVIRNRSLYPRGSSRYVLRPCKDGTFVKRYLYDKTIYNDNAPGGVIIQVYNNDDGEQCLPSSEDEILYDDINISLTTENLNKHNQYTKPGIYGYVVGWGGAGVKRYLFKSTFDLGNGNTEEVFMYEDDKGDTWTIYSDVHSIYYD